MRPDYAKKNFTILLSQINELTSQTTEIINIIIIHFFSPIVIRIANYIMYDYLQTILRKKNERKEKFAKK